MDHQYLVTKDGQAWTRITSHTGYPLVFVPIGAVIGAVPHTVVPVSTMNQEQLVLVGDKGGGISRTGTWIVVVVAPSVGGLVKDDVMNRMIIAALVDQVQFIVENGYRAAGGAAVRFISHLNLNVIVPSFALSVEGAVIQFCLFAASTVKAVQSSLELNQAGGGCGPMGGWEDCVVAPAVIGRIYRPPKLFVLATASVHAIQKIAVLSQSRAVSG